MVEVVIENKFYRTYEFPPTILGTIILGSTQFETLQRNQVIMSRAPSLKQKSKV